MLKLRVRVCVCAGCGVVCGVRLVSWCVECEVLPCVGAVCGVVWCRGLLCVRDALCACCVRVDVCVC